MLKILIIGSEGFIGSHSVEFFLQKGWQVYGVDFKDVPRGNYRYQKMLSHTFSYDILFKNIQPDVCLMAAGSANVSLSISQPLSDFDANTTDVIKVLESIRGYAPSCKFINLSSAAVYGSPEQLPVKETAVVHPLSPYGWHKYYSELLCKEYHTVYNLSTCSLRPFSVYGPGQCKLLFWDIYQKTKNNTESIELFGTGEESRDFIYIDDLVKGVFLIVSNAELKGEVYNLASGQETKIKNVAMLFLEQLGYHGQLVFNQKVKQGDPLNWCADISGMARLGYLPKVDINTGLKLYAEWVVNHELI
jgi:UDP-glucose 4-epimerase